MHDTVGTVLAHLNCHTHCVGWVVFILVGLVVIWFIACSQQLVVAGYYHCLSDNQQWQCTMVEGAGNLPIGQSTGRDR